MDTRKFGSHGTANGWFIRSFLPSFLHKILSIISLLTESGVFYQLNIRSNPPTRLGFNQLRDLLPASFNDLCISLSPHSPFSLPLPPRSRTYVLRRSPPSVKPRSKIYSKNSERAASANENKQDYLKVYNDSLAQVGYRSLGLHTEMEPHQQSRESLNLLYMT